MRTFFVLTLLAAACGIEANAQATAREAQARRWEHSPRLEAVWSGAAEASLPALEPESLPGYSTEDDGTSTLFLRIALDAPARLQLRNLRLAEGMRIFLYGVTTDGIASPVQGPIEFAGPQQSGEMWSEAFPAGDLIVEFQVDGDIPGDLPFLLDRLMAAPEGPTQVIVEAPREAAEVRTSLFRGRVVTHAVVNGEAVLEGDMLLGPADELPAAHGKEQAREGVGITDTRYRWPGGVVPYTIDPAMPNQTRITAAADHWNTKLAGVIRLVPRTNQANYVAFMANASSAKCSSYVGMASGMQRVEVGSSCSTGNVIHEIGHAVGLLHEQAREDRDAWVTVNMANVQAGAFYNFMQGNAYANDLIYYDYGSIMHYSGNAFSGNGKPTIETRPAGIPIGQRGSLSAGDIAAVLSMYGGRPGGVAAGLTPVTLATVPAGLALTVDGASLIPSGVLGWVPGSVHALSAPDSIPYGSSGSTYRFVRWTNNGAATQSVTASATPLTLTAIYRMEHRAAAAVSAAGGGAAIVDPAAPSQMYADGTRVAVMATPGSGRCFQSWSGLSSSTPAETSLTMSRSYSVTANFLTGSVTPAATSVTVAGAGTYALTATATTGCGWMVKTSTPWITLTKTYATASSPSVNYTVSTNTTGAPRTGTITVAGQPVTILQN